MVEVVIALESATDRQVAEQYGIPRRTVRNWAAKKHEILSYDGNTKNKNLTVGGRPAVFPSPHALVEYMDSVRAKERALSTGHIINWIKRHERPWLTFYLATKKPGSAYKSLLKLIERLCDINGFTRQIPDRFHAEFSAYDDSAIYNVDETGFYYGMPPRTIWSRRGGDTIFAVSEKHNFRMTAVLTVRQDGFKLPILFVIKGLPGGRIEQNEFPKFPPDYAYAVQENAWMDQVVWSTYL
ncbi:hypothetical protein LEN26_003112 [Aphanomyces euteiches]|nr:hypothetical protein AeMF1_011960 [Aphanomyces euteiches]KAH9158244.1 hypothetical protein LEN26_003112 [Aphanomyces euteiches]KAH9191044.1 hypothetical protein AeNC1_006978 [Aphanomyces euteiches]